MPIHLAPVSRRQFLVRSLAAGAGLVLGRELFASAKATDANSWALLSDIHLAGNPATLARGINMTEHLQTVSRELLGLAQRPAGVFITGDCAYNSGETADYAALAGLLKPLREGRLPLHIALGNHDNRERFWDAFTQERAARRPLKERQASVLKTPAANWFMLDSLEKTLSTPGLLGRNQLEWLAQALDQNADRPALVLVHHNPGLEGGNMGLKDTAALFEVIRPRKQVKAYIYGHTHKWRLEQDPSGIHLVNLPPVAYVFQKGDPAGWVRANLGSNALKLELRCVDPSHKDHGQTANLEWRV